MRSTLVASTKYPRAFAIGSSTGSHMAPPVPGDEAFIGCALACARLCAAIIEELFAQEVGRPSLDLSDFPSEPGAKATERYCRIVPVAPFYRIAFDYGATFDYDGDEASARRQIAELAPEDLEGYDRFERDAKAIFERGFLELGYTYFGDIRSIARVAPDLLRLDALRTLFGFASKYFRADKMHQIFSFETLLIGGSPLRVPAIYAMIHFVKKTWACTTLSVARELWCEASSGS